MCCYECKTCKNWKKLCKFEKYATIAVELQTIGYDDVLNNEAEIETEERRQGSYREREENENDAD